MQKATPESPESEAGELAGLVMDDVDRKTLAAAQQTPAPPGQRRRRSVGAALGFALPLLVLVLLLQFGAGPLGTYFEQPLPPQQARQQAQDALDTVVTDLLYFLEDFEELPEALAEIGVPLDGDWTYTVTGADQFTLTLAWHGEVVGFSSADRQAVR